MAEKEEARELLIDEPELIYQSEEEWINAAMSSPCAASMDQKIAADRTPEEQESFKREVFQKIYANMGSEIPAYQLKNAIVIKSAKFHPAMVVMLMVLTLGIFYFFRPKDDDTILVLTENGRVYLLKVERPNIFGSDLQAAMMTFLRLLLVLLAIIMAPTLAWMVLGEQAVGDVGDNFGQENFMQQEVDLDTRLWKKAKKSTAILAGSVAALVILGSVWLYRNWPADYATRSRQSFSASSISSVQYTITGGQVARKLVMRLYFGKYPTQAVLDTAGLAFGCAAGPVPIADLCDPLSQGTGSGGSQSKASQKEAAQSTNFSPAFVTALTIVLFLVTSLDAGFTWWDRIIALSHLATVHEFCGSVPPAPEIGQAMCTKNVCQDWSKNINYDDSFCMGVQWYSDAEDPEVRSTCLSYGHQKPPCCGGCMLAAKGLVGGGWFEVLRTCLEVIGDIGTLLFSLVAARYAMAVSTSSEHVEIVCQRAPTCMGLLSVRSTQDFSLIEPLALDFLSQMFAEAWENQKDQQVVADPTSEDVEAEQDRGVKAYEENLETSTWEEFLKEGNIVQLDPTQNTMRVNIPRGPLGLQEGECTEEVIAAWSEMERMRFSDLGPIVLYALGIFVLVMAAAPAQKMAIGSHTLVGGTKVIEGFVTATVYFVLHTAFIYFIEYRQLMHAVVVTDMRLFYIRQKPRFLLASLFGSDLRVDAFRHDRNVFYGRCKNTTMPLIYRMLGFRYMPGETFFQSKFGAMKLNRQNGNAMDVFHVVSQLSRRDSFVTDESLKEAGCSDAILAECRKTVAKGMFTNKKGVWDIHLQPTDAAARSPDIYLCDEKEEPLFHWSGSEAGPLTMPYNSTTDVIVTTDRIFLWQRPVYKTFDCKTCLCWGTCQCGCLQRVFEASQLPNTISFLSYAALLSFSSESQVDPPLLTNPMHPPVQFGCIEECFASMTRCGTCDGAGTVNWEKCSCLPTRPAARSQLFLMWRSKFNAQQPDLTCVVRPYQDQATLSTSDPDDQESSWMEMLEHAGLIHTEGHVHQERMVEAPGGGRRLSVVEEKLKEIEILRRIMAAVQAAKL